MADIEITQETYDNKYTETQVDGTLSNEEILDENIVITKVE